MRDQLTLFFHSDNSAIAHEFLSDLGYDLEVTQLTEVDFKYNFLSIAEAVQTPIVLLLSQNWLKTGATLYNSLPVLEEIHKENRLFVVCIDGIITENGTARKLTTNIDTVADAMSYMKFWQEAYLRVRNQRKINDTKFNQEQEKVAKSISIEIGNIIKFFKDVHPIKLESLTGSNYLPFFNQFSFSTEKVEKEVVAGNQELDEINDIKLSKSSTSNEVNVPAEEVELIVQVDDPAEEAHFYDNMDTKVEGAESTRIGVENERIKPINVVDPEWNEPTNVSFVAIKRTVFAKESGSDEQVEKLYEELFEGEKNPTITNSTLDEIEEVPSLSVDNVLEKAIAYFYEDKDAQGFTLFENAIESTHSNNATLRYYYAYYLAKRKSAFDEAIHQLDTILLFDSKNDNAYFLLAELAEIKENFALAKNYYLQTYAINPDYPQINYRIGVILQEHFEGAEDEAARYLKEEVKKNEHNIDAYYRLGIYANEFLENGEEAEKYFLKVLAAEPAHGFVNYDLALIYHKKGDPLKAAFYYQEGCKNNPELKTDQNDMAFLNFQEEKPEKITAEKEITVREELFGETKTILITGATSGIGLATAEKFAKAGNCKLILAGRRIKRLIQITEAIKDNYNVPTTYLPFDIREVDEVKEAIASLTKPFDTIDVLINNAGLALGFSDIVNGDLADWETMIDTNVKGLLYATKEVAPIMIAQQKGHIINIGSIAGKEAYPNGNVYNATKAAVDILTKAMRLDLHKHNIRVGQVAPGHVETEFAINRFHGDEQKASIYEDFTPLSPVDIANIIFFMVSQPKHVNIQDVLVFPTQQASATVINRSGKL